MNSGAALPLPLLVVLGVALVLAAAAAGCEVEVLDRSEYARLRVRGGDGWLARSAASSSAVRAGGGESEGEEASWRPFPLADDGIGCEAGVDVAMVVRRALRQRGGGGRSQRRHRKGGRLARVGPQGRHSSRPPVRRRARCRGRREKDGTHFLEGGGSSTARPLPLLASGANEEEEDWAAAAVVSPASAWARDRLLLVGGGAGADDDEAEGSEAEETGERDEDGASGSESRRAEARVVRSEVVGRVFAEDDLDEDMDRAHRWAGCGWVWGCGSAVFVWVRGG